MNFKLLKRLQLSKKLLLQIIIVSVFSIGLNAQSTVYIDPTYTGGGSDGSIDKPYTAWSSVTGSLKSNTSYLQKKGTTATVSDDILAHRLEYVTFGVYGDGEGETVIKNTSTSAGGATFFIRACNDCVVDGLTVTATSYDLGIGIYIVDDYTDSEYTCSRNKIINCDVSYGTIGIKIQRIAKTLAAFDSTYVINTKVHNVYQDGIFIQGYAKTYNVLNGVFIDSCIVDSVNMSYIVVGNDPPQTVAGGDGIQVSQNVYDVQVRNTTVDRRGTGNKFCFIQNNESAVDESTSIGNCLIENCTFYVSDAANMGAALYLHCIESAVVRYNKIYLSGGWGVQTRKYTDLDFCYNLMVNEDGTKSEYLFDLAAGVNKIYNNTFSGSDLGIHYETGYDDTYVYNNIFNDVTKTSDLAGAGITDYNLHYNSSALDAESHSIFDKDPKFINVDEMNFALQGGSPCMDAGKDDLGFTHDIRGVSLPQGEGYDIGAYEFQASDTIAPAAPADLSATDVTYTSFKLSWTTTETDIVEYRVYKDDELYAKTEDLSIVIDGLTQGTSYAMKIKAKDSDGNISKFSEVLNVSTTASSDTESPTTPSGLTITRTGLVNFTLEWTPSSDNVAVDAYDIYLNDVVYVTLNDFDNSGTIKYIVEGLDESTSYSVYLKARDAVNNTSDKSAVVSTTTLAECSETVSWTNTRFSEAKSGVEFNVEFDITPDGDNMDGLLGLSSGDASSFGDNACIVRFYTEGLVDAYCKGVENGYTAENEFHYYAGETYHVKMVVDVTNNEYDVFINREGEEAVTIADDYAFRVAATSLNNYAMYSILCTFSVANVTVGDGTDGINDMQVADEYCIVYPNPATDKITVKVLEKSTVKIYALSGEVLKEKVIEAGANELSLGLEAGLYLIEVAGDSNMYCKKIIVK